MSRIGKLSIKIPQGVNVTVEGLKVGVTGPLGSLSFAFKAGIVIAVNNGEVSVSLDPSSPDRAMWGTAQRIISNMIHGVTKGFETSLNLTGVGYRANTIDNGVSINYGYSHSIKFLVKTQHKNSITLQAPKQDTIIVSGQDKEIVGRYVSELKKLRRFDIYKGKGMSITGEKITLKKRKAKK